jgi:CheY-like chemotaxis protein
MAAGKVLVIEDEPGARNGLGSLLAEDGYEVMTAGSAERGIEYLTTFAPDTIVCDFSLPHADGLHVLRQTREIAPGVFFIALTAACGDETSEDALRAEADLFLRKPVNLARLREALATAPAFSPEIARAEAC